MRPNPTTPTSPKPINQTVAPSTSVDVAEAQRPENRVSARLTDVPPGSALGKRSRTALETGQRVARLASTDVAAAAAISQAAAGSRQAGPAAQSAQHARSGQWPEEVEIPLASGDVPRGLSTVGRQLPKLNPQTLGRYMSQVVGDWPPEREELGNAIVKNLQQLQNSKKVQQHQLELTTHWHCLSQTEKCRVLESIASSVKLPDEGQPATPAREWLDHTTLLMEPEEHSALLAAASTEGKKLLNSLEKPLENLAAAEEKLKRFEHLANTMPMDHMFDYGGFMKETKRVYGTIPEKAKKELNVLVVGAGPAGIVAADGLNRLGVKVTVVEQHSDIGGRIRTVRLPAHDAADGTVSPTPMEMGAMRFASFPGNSYHSLIEIYELPTQPFPNPSTVRTSFLVNDVALELAPGEAPKDALMVAVKGEYERAMGALLDPIMRARASGDTGKLRTLFQSAIDEFDKHTFRSGMDVLLKKVGIVWGNEKWDKFNAVGIGVGGYAGYASTNFLEEFKFLADKRLERHVFLPGGANSVLHKIIDDDNVPGDGRSLKKLGAIKVDTAVTGISRNKEGKYAVTTKCKELTKVEEFTDVIFAAGPGEAERLGLTVPRAGEQALMTPDLANSVKKANLVPSTKLCVKVPKEHLDGVDLPGNVQSDHPFQQMYVLPEVEGATSRAIFMSYQFGDNAAKTASIGGEEQYKMAINVLRGVGGQQPDAPEYQRLVNLANVLEKGKDRMAFTAWGQEPHFGGAFKMDRPSEQSNTQRLWRSGLNKPEGLIFSNEMMTGEGGFASGAVSAAINGVQQLILRHGGTLPDHSPHHQEPLYRE